LHRKSSDWPSAVTVIRFTSGPHHALPEKRNVTVYVDETVVGVGLWMMPPKPGEPSRSTLHNPYGASRYES
jgi:hypothetical protein